MIEGRRQILAKIATVISIQLLLIAFSNAETLPISSSSYLGDKSNDEGVYGVRIKSSGEIVLVAEIGPETNIMKDSSRLCGGDGLQRLGAVIILSPDGKTIRQKSVISAQVKDVSLDSKDKIYVACGRNGVVCLSPDAKKILWKALDGTYVHRIDVGSDGTVAVLADLDEKMADSKSGPGVIHIFNNAGNEIKSFPGPGEDSKDRNILDICVDSKSKAVIVAGWRQASDWSEAANKGGPVQIALLRGIGYDGKIRWNAYDWSTDGSSPRYLNKPENNMADTRGLRCTIGEDGKLYAVYGVAGGNHIFRYSPFDIITKVMIQKGDSFTDFSSTKSQHKTFFGRYNPENGEYEAGQQLTARSAPLTTNTLWCDEGDIFADVKGRAYLAGVSASGLPIMPNKMLSKEDARKTFNPFGVGSYLGGPFLIISSPDLIRREYVTRISPYGGFSRTVAARTLDDGSRIVAWGGTVKLVGPAYVKDALQAVPGFGEDDAFFTVLSSAEANDAEIEGRDCFEISVTCGIEGKKNIRIRNADPQIAGLPSEGNQKRIAIKHPWSDDSPLTPPASAGYKGTPVYGGLFIEVLNPSPNRKNLDRNQIESPFKLNFGTRAREAEKLRMRAALFVKTADANESSPDDKFSFDQNSSIEVSMACPSFVTYPWKNEEGKPTWKVHFWISTDFRWLVKDSGKFYLSNRTEKWKNHQDNKFILGFQNDSDDGEWAEWSPSDLLDFDPASAKFARMDFNRIEGVGIWLSDPEFRPNSESEQAGQNKPGSADAGIQVKGLSARLALNKESLKRPIAKFSVSESKPVLGQQIKVDASQSQPVEGIINFYSWDFGSGTMTSGAEASHTYRNSGPHKIRLVVWNDKFQSSKTEEKTIEVFPFDTGDATKRRIAACFGGMAGNDMPKIERNGKIQTAEIKDIDGDGVPDKESVVPFDDENPFSTLSGTRIYAGWRDETKMIAGAKNETHINNALDIGDHAKYKKKDTRGLYTIGYRVRKELPGRVRFIAMILKEDFMNGWNDSGRRLGLVKGTELVAGPFAEFPATGKTRFVIRDQEGYWVSDKSFTGQEKFNSNVPFQSLPVFKIQIGEGGKDEARWTKLDPRSSLEVASKAVFIARQFKDVTGFGILSDSGNVGTGGELQIYGFTLYTPQERTLNKAGK